jgi:hypothetical protein
MQQQHMRIIILSTSLTYEQQHASRMLVRHFGAEL